MLEYVRVLQYSYSTLVFLTESCKTKVLYLCAFCSIFIWFQSKAGISFGSKLEEQRHLLQREKYFQKASVLWKNISSESLLGNMLSWHCNYPVLKLSLIEIAPWRFGLQRGAFLELKSKPVSSSPLFFSLYRWSM